MPLFWHGQLIVLVLQIYIHRILVYSLSNIQKALYPCITFICVLYCFPLLCNLLWSLIFIECNLFIYTLYILVTDGIVVIAMKCSSVCVLFCLVLTVIRSFSSLRRPGKFRVASFSIRALVYKAQRARHIRTIRKNSSDIGLVISN